MKKILEIFVQLFKAKEKTYLLRLEDFIYKNDTIICVFSQKGAITPVKFFIDEVLTSKNIFTNVCPESLLVIKDVYANKYINRPAAKIICYERCNNYEISIDGRIIIMSGKDICKDKKLLSSFEYNDVFNIIYNTAYLNAFNDFSRKAHENNAKSNKAICLKIIK